MEQKKDLINLFDLEDFYINDRDAAVIIVSDNMDVSEYSPKSHEKVAENIIKIIDPTFKMFYDQSNYCWQNQATNRGIVCIQLCSNCQSLIWLPNKINTFQYKYLINLNNKYNKIKQKHNLSDDQTIYVILNINNKNTMVNLNDSLNIIKHDKLQSEEEKQTFNYK